VATRKSAGTGGTKSPETIMVRPAGAAEDTVMVGAVRAGL